jgi:DNA-binding transcriptional LysR family regulator
MVQSVLDSRLDLAIVPRFNYTNEKLKSVDVSGPIKLICFAGRDQVINKQPLDWEDLYNYPIVTGLQTSVVRRMIDEQLKSKGIEVRPLAIEVDNVGWCIALVEYGKGLSFAFMVDIEKKVNEGQLKIVRLSEDLYLSAVAVMRPGVFISPIIERYLSMVKQAFSSVANQG